MVVAAASDKPKCLTLPCWMSSFTARSTAACSSVVIFVLSFGGPYDQLMPMQPSPIAETSRLLLPSLRFCIFLFLFAHAVNSVPRPHASVRSHLWTLQRVDFRTFHMR